MPVQSPQGAGVEPPESSNRLVSSRPFSGISVTVFSSMVCLNETSSVCSARPSAVTSTFSPVEPTVICTFTAMLLPISSTMPVCVYALNPGTDTDSEYFPMSIFGKTYTPLSSLLLASFTCVDVSVSVTAACGITAPVASVIVP